MFDGVKKAWEESQTRLMKSEYEAAKATLDGLSRVLSDRAIQVLFDAHDITLRQVGSFENITTEGRNKLIKAFRSDAKSCQDLDISKSIGLKLFSLWLEALIRKNEDGRYVHYNLNLNFRARELMQQAERKRSKEIPAESDWNYANFDEWYEIFKSTAGMMNLQLEQSSDGVSLIDFMDDTGLRKSYANKIEPQSLARQFAKDYDFSTFGR